MIQTLTVESAKEEFQQCVSALPESERQLFLAADSNLADKAKIIASSPTLFEAFKRQSIVGILERKG